MGLLQWLNPFVSEESQGKEVRIDDPKDRLIGELKQRVEDQKEDKRELRRQIDQLQDEKAELKAELEDVKRIAEQSQNALKKAYKADVDPSNDTNFEDIVKQASSETDDTDNDLTPTEKEIFEALRNNEDRISSRADAVEILSKDYGRDITPSTLSSHVQEIREKGKGDFSQLWN